MAYPSDAQLIWNFLVSAIGNEFGVAGLMGNMQAESGFLSYQLQGDLSDPTRARSWAYTNGVDGGTISKNTFCADSKGYGLCQWTIRYRKTNLYEWTVERGHSVADLGAQLQFLMRELNGEYPLTDYSSVLSYIQNVSPPTPTPEGTAQAITLASTKVLTDFESPADQSDAVKRYRANLSIEVYNTFSGSPPVPPVPPVPPTPTTRPKPPLFFYCIKRFRQKKGLLV